MYFKQADNISLWYERVGKGPPLVMIHGLGSCGSDWMFQVPKFQANYEVITIDLRGHGRSSKPRGPYDVGALAKDVASLLSSLKVGPAYIVGLSLGSFVALQLACDFPHLVKSLVLTGTTSCIKDIGRWHLLLRLMLLSVCPMSFVAKAVAFSLFPQANQENIRRTCQLRMISNEKRVYRSLFRQLIGFDVKERLAEIGCPMLIVVGANDTLTPIWHAEEIVKRTQRAELVIIEGARHAAPLDSPKKFNELLENFLERGRYGISR